MLKLIWCELYKYKRNRIIPVLTAFSLLFPFALGVITQSKISGATTLAEAHAYYDNLFNDNLVYSSMLLLPGLFGCMSAVLFFNERDCDTFKNLRTIPVTRNELIFTKLVVMYLWAEVYSICSALSATLFCFFLEPAAVYDVLFKTLCSMLTGITMATVSLPVAVIVIYTNQNFLLSLMLSFSYSVVNWILLILFSSNEGILRWLPLMNGLFLTSRIWGWRKAFWGLGNLAALPFQEYIRVVLYLVCVFLVCAFLIIRFYRKWSR